MDKSSQEIWNEIEYLLNFFGNHGIDDMRKLSRKVWDICFEHAARMAEQGKTAKEIREFSESMMR